MGAFGPIKINQPIEIEVNFSLGINKFKSRVEGITEKNLVVAAPMVNRQIVPLKIGTQVTVSYLDNAALYTFDTVVLATDLKPVPTLTLDKPYNIKRVQRRNFVRIDAKIPMTFCLLKENLEKNSDFYYATTIDISGGGIMFSTENPLHLGDLLEIHMAFPDGVNVLAIGKVVRVIKNGQGDQQMYSVGIEFNIIEESERDKIIRYIFNQQRELRRKGLL
ncbi:flagellar brake protein [Thermincola potens]|uniref:Type IV pilus assembly PilZ n=1 Tax=Thermincola potens (strain JR) TaxID=635013 RepID=D5XFF1_THEPJ|nr:flagellar brake domain-containing protein [Thermincola potens]ADG82372.1 type IV pilus assembly PilZ [Thermincola potens JR]